MYWLESPAGSVGGPGTILRANLDGSGVETVIPSVPFHVTFNNFYQPGIALNAAAGKLYYSADQSLMVANLDGSNPTTLYTMDSSDCDNNAGTFGRAPVHDMVVHNGKLYWLAACGPGSLPAPWA